MGLADVCNYYDADAWSYYLKNDGELYSCLADIVKNEEDDSYRYQMGYVKVSSDIEDILDFKIVKKTDKSIWYIGYDNAARKFLNQKIISAEVNIQSTNGRKLKYLDYIEPRNLSDYFFRDSNGKTYMVDQENRVLVCDGELAKAGDESAIDLVPTDSETAMPILKTNIRMNEEYKGYGNLIELKDGNLYSNGVTIMTNVVDFFNLIQNPIICAC